MYKGIEKYTKDTGGNMSAMFAGVVFLALAGIGVAVDMTGLMSQRAKLQSYADMAVLAAASSDEKTEEDLRNIAQAVVTANKRQGETYDVKFKILEDNSIRVTVTQDYQYSMMGIFGVKSDQIKVLAEAPPKGGVGKINLALVLDVTESMAGSKLAALKTAATDLVDDLDDASEGTTQFSVVPFARYVKIPTSYSSASWINVAAPGWETWQELDGDASTNCTQMGSGENAWTQCDNYVYIDHTVWKEWVGCMGSRNYPWYERAHVTPGQKLQGFTVDDWCGSGDPMLPLTDNVTSVTTAISGLSTHQDTYIPAGLAWGWRTLTPEEPLTEADTDDYAARSSALILMTDGENTQNIGGTTENFDGNFHWDGNGAAANTTTTNLCNNIKADGITIYTIAFEVTDTATQTMLEGCASDAEKYFDADNAAELAEAFDGIGKDLSAVRLSK